MKDISDEKKIQDVIGGIVDDLKYGVSAGIRMQLLNLLVAAGFTRKQAMRITINAGYIFMGEEDTQMECTDDELQVFVQECWKIYSAHRNAGFTERESLEIVLNDHV